MEKMVEEEEEDNGGFNLIHYPIDGIIDVGEVCGIEGACILG
jgi:hypothetical protein